MALMARELSSIPGTVSEVFTRRVNEINFEAPLPQLKQQIIDILRCDEIKKTCGAEKFVAHIQILNNRSAIMSTVGTYITCIRCKPSKKEA